MEKKSAFANHDFFSSSIQTSLPRTEVHNDDDPISVQTFPEEYKIEETLRISLKFCFDHVQLSSETVQEIPVCLFLENGTSGRAESGRPGVDIVLLIDLSGSMMGSKIDLVKKTILFMVSKLNANDRVSLVTFNNSTQKVCRLLSMNDNNKKRLAELVSQMKAFGGTEIVQGLDLGLKILAGRKITNSVTSVILLSDGKDNNSHSAMPRTKEILIRSLHEITSGFSIHTFGYGGDHDASLLSSMAEEKNGGFYFIEHENSIPLVFSNCLGELISVVADNIQVSLNFVPSEVQCELGKIYSENGTNNFRMPPVLSGDSKEAVFMLVFPPCRGGIRESTLIRPLVASVTYKVMKTGRSCYEERSLEVLVHPENAEIEDIQLEAEVMINFYRVKTCDVIKEAALLADRRNIQGARDLLTNCLTELRESVVSDHEVILALAKDVEEAALRLRDQHAYDVGCKADMLSKANNHYSKRAAVPSYQNSVQSSLKTESVNFFASKKKN